MIKINLGRGFTPQKQGFFSGFSSGGAAPAQAAGSDMGEFDFGLQISNRQLIVNLVLLLLGPIVMFLHQDSNLPPKQARLNQINTELSSLQAKNTQAAASVDEIKRYEKEQEKLEFQIKAINRLQKDRLREVRVLDYIQREIPERVWLSKLELNDNKMTISGTATADTELTNFMENLQKSAYLKDVNLLRSTEATVPEMGVVRKFEISCLLETAP
jgi:type IV pilus assembly protein PilN